MIRILIVDDVSVIRNGLNFMLREEKEFEIVGMARDGEEAIELSGKLKPDIVLMDLKMPNCNGISATKTIKSKYPNIKILILTTFKEEENVFEALKYGAIGYILKDIDTNELINVIKNASKGIVSIHQDVFNTFKSDIDNKKNKVFQKSIDNIDETSDAELKLDKIELTQKEKEIIKLMIKGKNYKEISKELYISEGSIRNMISELLKQFGLKDRIQLAVYVIKNNII